MRRLRSRLQVEGNDQAVRRLHLLGNLVCYSAIPPSFDEKLKEAPMYNPRPRIIVFDITFYMNALEDLRKYAQIHSIWARQLHRIWCSMSRMQAEAVEDVLLKKLVLGRDASNSERLLMPETFGLLNRPFVQQLASKIPVGVIILPRALKEAMLPKLTSFLLEVNDRYEGGGTPEESHLFRNAALVTLYGAMKFGKYEPVDNQKDDVASVSIVTNDSKWFHRGVEFAKEAVIWLYNSFYTKPSEGSGPRIVFEAALEPTRDRAEPAEPLVQNASAGGGSTTLATEETAEDYFHCFMSHCWGQLHTVHKKVLEIKRLFRNQDLKVWVDQDHMGSRIDMSIIKGIEDSCCFVLCSTREFGRKADDLNRVIAQKVNFAQDELERVVIYS